METSFSHYLKMYFKQKAVRPDFWLTHLIIYIGLIFISKRENANLVLPIIIAVAYPLMIVLLESLGALYRYNKKGKGAR